MKTFLTQLSIAATVLSIVTPAYSASISFRPAGQQLDTDPINDLGVNVGQQFAFTLSIDTTGLSTNLKSFTYTITRDDSEILLDSVSIPSEATTLFTRNQISDIPSGGLTVGTIQYTINSGQTFGPNRQLDFAIPIYTVQPGLVNDGLPDYDIQLTEVLDVNDTNILNQFATQRQTLDVQQAPEGSSTLGLLVLGTLSAASAFKRQLKTK